MGLARTRTGDSMLAWLSSRGDGSGLDSAITALPTLPPLA
jgi:hypothetical protein